MNMKRTKDTFFPAFILTKNVRYDRVTVIYQDSNVTCVSYPIEGRNNTFKTKIEDIKNSDIRCMRRYVK